MPEASGSLQASDWIAIAAFVVSGLALFVSVFELLQNRPKLRVVVSSAAVIPGREGISYTDKPRILKPEETGPGAELYVAVEITNFGRQPTTLKAISFFSKTAGKFVFLPPVVKSAGLPKQIAPSEFAAYFFSGSEHIDFSDGRGPRRFIDFVFEEKPDLHVRHSWQFKPMIVKGLKA